MTPKTKAELCYWNSVMLLIAMWIAPLIAAGWVHGATCDGRLPEFVAALVFLIFVLALWVNANYWEKFIKRGKGEGQ